MGPIFIFLVPLFYLGLAIVLVMGWKRGGREGKTRDRFVLLSRIGFVFGTSSASVAVMTAISLRLYGSFQYHDSKLSWFYTIGALFALLGIVLSIIGAWRRNVLRWHALILSAGMLLLWCAWMSGE
jgi:peptidoglycan/LPS O-acetylase OafA/YrhL